MTKGWRAALAAALTAAVASPAVAETPSATGAGQQVRVERVEVAFVLDTTGSMADLIDGAKKKVWSIADGIAKSRPDADIRFALVGYRDRGDLYVTDVTDLTADMHGVYGKLIGYEADGGGDWPESVNEALHTAVTRLSWTKGDGVRRLVFLVGDAPPHMDYPQDIAFTDTLKMAARDAIVVNAVQAGDADDTELAWKAIASLGGGDYIAIPQSGNVAVIETPYDGQIKRLQLKLNLTVLPYGDRAQQSAVEDKLRLKAEAPAPAASDMAAYESRAVAPGKRAVVGGSGDLVGDVVAGKARLEAVPEADLPAALKELDPAARAGKVEALVAERAAVQAELDALIAERDGYLASAAATAPEADSFDGAVAGTIAKQIR